MWKTLEVAINHANLPLDLCLFICTKTMGALRSADTGGMTFVPLVVSSSADSMRRFNIREREWWLQRDTAVV